MPALRAGAPTSGHVPGLTTRTSWNCPPVAHPARWDEPPSLSDSSGRFRCDRQSDTSRANGRPSTTAEPPRTERDRARPHPRQLIIAARGRRVPPVQSVRAAWPHVMADPGWRRGDRGRTDRRSDAAAGRQVQRTNFSGGDRRSVPPWPATQGLAVRTSAGPRSTSSRWCRASWSACSRSRRTSLCSPPMVSPRGPGERGRVVGLLCESASASVDLAGYDAGDGRSVGRGCCVADPSSSGGLLGSCPVMGFDLTSTGSALDRSRAAAGSRPS